jgi:hypothetical protein
VGLAVTAGAASTCTCHRDKRGDQGASKGPHGRGQLQLTWLTNRSRVEKATGSHPGPDMMSATGPAAEALPPAWLPQEAPLPFPRPWGEWVEKERSAQAGMVPLYQFFSRGQRGLVSRPGCRTSPPDRPQYSKEPPGLGGRAGVTAAPPRGRYSREIFCDALLGYMCVSGAASGMGLSYQSGKGVPLLPPVFVVANSARCKTPPHTVCEGDWDDVKKSPTHQTVFLTTPQRGSPWSLR